MAATQVETFTAASEKTGFKILATISLCHFINDMLSSVLPATYPMLKESFRLNFAQIGLITLTYQFTASLLQPLVGLHTDRRPKPYSLSAGMGLSLLGILVLAMAHVFGMLVAGRRSWESGPPYFIPSLRGWRAWLRAANMAWRSRFFKLAGTQDLPWDRFW